MSGKTFIGKLGMPNLLRPCNNVFMKKEQTK